MPQPRQPRPALAQPTLWLAAAAFLFCFHSPGMAAASVPTPSQPGPAYPGNTKPELHTFTGTDGHTFRAKIVSLVADTVNFLPEDGSSLRLPLTSLIKADQTYVMATVLQQRRTLNEAILTFAATTQNSDETSANSSGAVIRKWREVFKVTVKNETPFNLTNLRVEYIIFKTPLAPDITSKATLPRELYSRVLALDALGRGASKTFSTEPFEMQNIKSAGNVYFTDYPGAHSVGDVLDAIWMRVYDADNGLILEWSSSSTVVHGRTWDNDWVEGGGKANP